MVLNKAGREIPQEYADQYGVYEGELARIKPYEAASRKIKPVEPRQEKLLGSIREAIEKTGQASDLLYINGELQNEEQIKKITKVVNLFRDDRSQLVKK